MLSMLIVYKLCFGGNKKSCCMELDSYFFVYIDYVDIFEFKCSK